MWYTLQLGLGLESGSGQGTARLMWYTLQLGLGLESGSGQGTARLMWCTGMFDMVRCV